MYSEKVEVNKNCVNACINAKILSDEDMRRIGFTDHCADRWYFCRRVEGFRDLTFNVSIPKNGDDFSIDVLDECFLQPYDYQGMLHRNPKFEPALRAREGVEYWMEYLEKEGVLSGHIRYEYI